MRWGGEREIRVLVERGRGVEKERENGKVLVKKRVLRVRVGEQQERESGVAIAWFIKVSLSSRWFLLTNHLDNPSGYLGGVIQS